MKPIPVDYIRFEGHAQEGPGINTSTLTDARGNKRQGSRHIAHYHPWVRMFWVEHYTGPALSSGSVLESAAYIPLERVQFWAPLDGPIEPPKSAAGRPPKAK